jgi:hypothetical protein
VPGSDILTIDASDKTGGPANPQQLNRYAYVTNNPLRYSDPTGHCGKSSFGDTAITVMSGDCTRRAYEALTRADTTEGQVVSGAVMVASAVGAGAGWAGGILLAVAGGQAVVGAIAGGSGTAEAASVGGTVAAAASADGNPTNELESAAPAIARAQSLINNVVQTELSNTRLSFAPEYNPAIKFPEMGRALPQTYTQIGPAAIEGGRAEVLKTIVHEEMHHRLWSRYGTAFNVEQVETFVEDVAQRFARMKGYQ